jgi:hypothetical protein
VVGAERLAHVVVGTGVQGRDDGVVVVPGGGDDDGDRGDGPEHPQQLAAVHVRQPEVEHDEVRAVLDRDAEARHGGGRGRDDVSPVAEGAHHGRADALVVLDDQELCHASLLLTGCHVRSTRTLVPRGCVARQSRPTLDPNLGWP